MYRIIGGQHLVVLLTSKTVRRLFFQSWRSRLLSDQSPSEHPWHSKWAIVCIVSFESGSILTGFISANVWIDAFAEDIFNDFYVFLSKRRVFSSGVVGMPNRIAFVCTSKIQRAAQSILKCPLFTFLIEKDRLCTTLHALRHYDNQLSS